MRTLIITLMLLLFSAAAYAHQTSTSFLSLAEKDGRIDGLWRVSISSLNTVRAMDNNNDGKVQWSEVVSNKNILFLVLNAAILVTEKNNSCIVALPEEGLPTASITVEELLGEFFINMPFFVNCEFKSLTGIRYNYFMDYDNDHKGIVTLTSESNQSDVYMVSVNNSDIEINGQVNKAFLNIVGQGIWHIWIGFDHIIFVLTLIIGVMFRKNFAETGKVSNITEIVKVVTAFTLAHSITLGLAAFVIVELPVQLVESFIAVTLVFAALHNIQGMLPKHLRFIFSWPLWKMAFIFGLVHGFGFANVLAELNLAAADLALSLFAFNLGVEVGQIAIVLVFALSITGVLSCNNIKNNRLEAVLPVSSALVILLGSVWIVERSFNIAVF